ncbi:MAG TPA: GNAT family N-acetyltransferase [Chloroflexia bacterium]|nr:GNAT family N-acetyltransferase [Chloroflexia bacterium]
MTWLTPRAFAGPADLEQVLAVRRAATTPQNATQFPTLVDLREMLDPAVAESMATTCLWTDPTGQARAYAHLMVPYGNLLFHTDPAVVDPDLPAAMVAWATVQMRGRPGTEEPELNAYARSDDTERVALLEAQGFVRQPGATLHMVRPLAEPIPDPQFPPGFTVRSIAGEHEAEAYVDLHRAAFGTSRMTVAQRLAIMRNPAYCADLDLVAIAPDGTWAAFCVCNIDPEANARTGRAEAEIGIVGTRLPGYRGQGLGRAMLLTGLRVLQAASMDTATLGTDSDNAPAIRLYESVGFRTIARTIWLRKAV